MSVSLTEGQNFLIGTIAAFIEGVLLQPTLYWKNAKAQNLPFTLNPKLLYRGTAASIFNECQMMGLQFGLTGFFQKVFKSGESVKLTRTQEFSGAACGGIFTALFASPMELIMIQQQKNGGSFFATPKNIVKNHGFLQKGFLRGLTGEWYCLHDAAVLNLSNLLYGQNCVNCLHDTVCNALVVFCFSYGMTNHAYFLSLPYHRHGGSRLHLCVRYAGRDSHSAGLPDGETRLFPTKR